MSEIVASKDLKVGMFVAELDRPWTETPFLIQGFLVQNETQLKVLRERCNFVSIDRTRSVGDGLTATPDVSRNTGAPDRQSGMSVVWQKTIEEPPPATPFFDVLRSVRKSPASSRSSAQLHAHQTPRQSEPAADTTDAEMQFEFVGQANAPTKESGTRSRAPAARAPAPAQRAHLNRATQPSARPVEVRTMSIAGKLSALFPRRKRGHLKAAVARNRKFEALLEHEPRKRRVAVESMYVDAAAVEEELLTSNVAFDRTQDLITDLASEMAKEKMPDVERIRDAVSGMVESVVRNPDALMWLAKLKRTDNYAYDHALDVSVHLMAFGRHLGLPLPQLNILGVAGLMQDIGKISLPLDLLKKTGKLTLAEQAVMKKHVEVSERILSAQPDIPPEALEIVARHHERIDGRGYPNGLKGDEVGLFAEMAGIVDTYCAMTSDRPYRPAVDNQHALERLYARRGKSFSESAVIEFVHCIGIYPVGTLVELNTGEVAVVIAQNRTRQLKPRILVLLTVDKTPNQFPAPLDLVYAPVAANGKPYRIHCALPNGAYGLDPQEFYL